MRIGLIGDIHANLPALESVLKHAEEHSVEQIWNVGDSVGYGAFPEQVIQIIKTRLDLNLKGNYDIKVLQFPKKNHQYFLGKLPEKYLAFKWAYENLSTDSRRYLSALPEQIYFTIQGYKILLSHAGPAFNKELLTLETPNKRLKHLAKLAGKTFGLTDILIFGHSHRPFHKTIGGVWYINVGSVGRPDDGDPRASYAILELGKGTITLKHFRVEYDIQRAIDAILSQGLPIEFAQMIQQGYDLDTVLNQNINRSNHV
jgi:putative phosphoesterase